MIFLLIQDFPLAAGVQEVFQAVGEFVDVGQAEEPGIALEAVYRAEDPVDDLTVAGIFFQGDEVRLDSLERIVGFIDKALECVKINVVLHVSFLFRWPAL